MLWLPNDNADASSFPLDPAIRDRAVTIIVLGSTTADDIIENREARDCFVLPVATDAIALASSSSPAASSCSTIDA